MTKTKGFLLTAGIVLAMVFTLSCSSDGGGDDPPPRANTYYIESGSVSVYAYEWFNSNPGVSAYDVLQILNQYPVTPDPYKEVQRGVSRKELEAEWLSLDVPGFSKEQFLRLLDTGAAIQFFITLDGGYIYLFVERES